MIYQYTAAALVSEHKVLAHPASVDSIPTSANQEDHVSMGSIAARHARAIVAGVERIVAIELVVAAQALDLRLAAMAAATAPPAPGAGVAEAHRRIRARVADLDRDREPGPDLAAATALVHDGALADLVDGLSSALREPAAARLLALAARLRPPAAPAGCPVRRRTASISAR